MHYEISVAKMTDVKPDSSSTTTTAGGSAAHSNGGGDDPLSHLYKMSVTAGLGSTDYVAVNGLAVTAVFVGLASALSLVDNIFLVIPLVAVIFAVMSLRQIGQSNGTQSGKFLSWLGLILAILFAGSVGGRDLYQAASNHKDEDQIIQVINEFDQHVRAGEFSKAYLMFSGKFTSKVTEQTFADLMRKTAQVPGNGPRLTGIQFNGHIEFNIAPDNGLAQAVAMTIFTWDRQIPDQRIPFVFKQKPDGSWQIEDVPMLFPSQQQPPRRR